MISLNMIKISETNLQMGYSFGKMHLRNAEINFLKTEIYVKSYQKGRDKLAQFS